VAVGDGALGIDVSAHQASTPPLAGLSFLFARATYGTARDAMLATHVARARAAGLVVGAYHFGRATDVDDQVTAFLQAVLAAGNVDLLALDLESDGGNPAMSSTQARAFLAGVRARGRRIGLYHSASGYPSLGQDWRWVADYRASSIDAGGPPVAAWDVWQYRGSPLDLDVFSGSPDELRAFAARMAAVTPAPITDEHELVITLKDGHAWYELDGTTRISTGHPALPARRSPYGVGTKRAMFATVAGNRRIVLVSPATATPPPPPPAPDCSQAIADAKADQKAADQAIAQAAIAKLMEL
jgi:hypothetical protein